MGVAAERAGWDGVFLEDYLVYYRGDDPPTFDPWVLLSAIAARTDHVWLGTTVSGLLARDPVKLAREAATLDALAPGRVVLGLGLGDPADRGIHVGPASVAPAGSRGKEMDRRFDLVLDLLAGRPVPGRLGEPDVTFRPASSRVRVWVGGSSQAKAVTRRAARADGVVPYKLTDVDQWSDYTRAEIRQLAATIAAHRDRRVQDFDVAIGGRTRRPEPKQELAAIEEARRGGATWWLEFVAPGPAPDMLDHIGRGPLSPPDPGPG